MTMRQRVIEAGFEVIGRTRLHRVAAPFTQGLGGVLMFHHVRPPVETNGFSPNGLLEITPEFLDATLTHLRRSGFAIVTMDQAVEALRAGRGQRFAALTFDDGYRDNRDWALSILERHKAPATFYITTGYADRTARLWWVELETAIRQASRLSVCIGAETLDLDVATPQAKAAAFQAIYWRLRDQPEAVLLATIATLCAQHGVDGRALVDAACLDWSELSEFARHPLVTIGAHTLTHPMLAKHPEIEARREIEASKALLEERLGVAVRHLAYPVGDPTSAGPRDFALARALGFASAVTTRPGLLFAGHADHLTALPRVSVNGNHQSLRSLDILLSGAAFALWNRGRRVNAS